MFSVLHSFDAFECAFGEETFEAESFPEHSLIDSRYWEYDRTFGSKPKKLCRSLRLSVCVCVTAIRSLRFFDHTSLLIKELFSQ